MWLLPEELNWPAVAERPLSLRSEPQWLLAFRHDLKGMNCNSTVTAFTVFEMEYVFLISNRKTIYFIAHSLSDLGAPQIYTQWKPELELSGHELRYRKS